jgi:hypothetical protein
MVKKYYQPQQYNELLCQIFKILNRNDNWEIDV